MKSRTFFFGFLIAVITIIAGCATTPASDGPVTVEAEDMAYEGNIVVNGMPDGDDTIAEGSGDILYMQDSGEIPFVFEVTEAGEYLVKIYYAIPESYGEKFNHIHVNGEYVEEASFPQTGSQFEAKWVGVFELTEGTNVVSVSHSWGYTWFDYATIEPVE